MLAKNTHDKCRKYRKNNKFNKIPDLERKEAERFQRAKNILVTFAIFADISGFFLASFVSKSWFLLDLLFLRFCDICKWFSDIIFSQLFLLRQLRRKIASKFLLTRSILDISSMAKKKKKNRETECDCFLTLSSRSSLYTSSMSFPGWCSPRGNG